MRRDSRGGAYRESTRPRACVLGLLSRGSMVEILLPVLRQAFAFVYSVASHFEASGEATEGLAAEDLHFMQKLDSLLGRGCFRSLASMFRNGPYRNAATASSSTRIL